MACLSVISKHNHMYSDIWANSKLLAIIYFFFFGSFWPAHLKYTVRMKLSPSSPMVCLGFTQKLWILPWNNSSSLFFAQTSLFNSQRITDFPSLNHSLCSARSTWVCMYVAVCAYTHMYTHMYIYTHRYILKFILCEGRSVKGTCSLSGFPVRDIHEHQPTNLVSPSIQHLTPITNHNLNF